MMIRVKGSFCSVWAGASLYYATVWPPLPPLLALQLALQPLPPQLALVQCIQCTVHSAQMFRHSAQPPLLDRVGTGCTENNCHHHDCAAHWAHSAFLENGRICAHCGLHSAGKLAHTVHSAQCTDENMFTQKVNLQCTDENMFRLSAQNTCSDTVHSGQFTDENMYTQKCTDENMFCPRRLFQTLSVQLMDGASHSPQTFLLHHQHHCAAHPRHHHHDHWSSPFFAPNFEISSSTLISLWHLIEQHL